MRYLYHGAIAVLMAILVVTAMAAHSEEEAGGVELIGVARIWDRAGHNAFTGLVRHNDRWWCTFREADGHVKGDGKLRVIVSDDGEAWESAALLAEEGIDLRDPKISVTPDGRLMLVAGGSVYRDGEFVTRQSRVAFSKDGVEWSQPQRVLEEGQWLWRVTWHEGKCFGVTYNSTPENIWPQVLYVSNDGINYEAITPFDCADKAGETTLRFLPDGRMVALVRVESGDAMGFVGHSAAPYTDWTWNKLDHRLGGPDFMVMPDGSMWAGSRKYGENTSTVLARLTLDSYTPVAEVPSGGDTSYPGLVYQDGVLWMSYYASHEDKTCIYLAKFRLPQD